MNKGKNRRKKDSELMGGEGLYLVKELRAEWCWMSVFERWRGCGRDGAPGAEKLLRVLRWECPIPSSAVRALPNLNVRRRET